MSKFIHKNLRVHIAADHGAFELKSVVSHYINDIDSTVNIINHGTDSANSVDYPHFAHAACTALLSDQKQGVESIAVLLCGSGIGMSIVANRYSGIRAALCHSKEYAQLSRQHNDANILVLGARFLSKSEVKSIIYEWFHAEFEGLRHQRRIDLIDIK